MPGNSPLSDFWKINSRKIILLTLLMAGFTLVMPAIAFSYARNLKQRDIAWLLVPVIALNAMQALATTCEYYLFLNRRAMFSNAIISSFLNKNNFAPVFLYANRRLTMT